MDRSKEMLRIIETELESAQGWDCLADNAARLILEARRDRDEARREAESWRRVLEAMTAERDAALLSLKEARLRGAEADRNADIATRLEAERDAAVTAHQESLQTVAELRESLRVAEARAERFKAEMYRVDEVQTAKLLVATDRVAALEGELATWKEDHAEAMRLAWENGERRDAALARVRELESTPASRLWHDKFKARIAQLEARVQDLAPYEHEVGAVHRYNSELAERIAELEECIANSPGRQVTWADQDQEARVDATVTRADITTGVVITTERLSTTTWRKPSQGWASRPSPTPRRGPWGTVRCGMAWSTLSAGSSRTGTLQIRLHWCARRNHQRRALGLSCCVSSCAPRPSARRWLCWSTSTQAGECAGTRTMALRGSMDGGPPAAPTSSRWTMSDNVKVEKLGDDQIWIEGRRIDGVLTPAEARELYKRLGEALCAAPNCIHGRTPAEPCRKCDDE